MTADIVAKPPTIRSTNSLLSCNKSIVPTFYMDEAGYTGYDLLNEQQRFQGAAALQMDEGTAKALVKEHFPRTKLTELKHQKLSRRKSNWDALLNLQRIILRDYSSFTYVCDKRYLLTLMFLDSCVEPFFYDRGIDFYQDGHNYGLASLLYHTAPSFWGARNFDEVLYLFQCAQRSKSDVAIQALVEKAKSLRGRELSENLLPLAMEDASCLREIRNVRTSTDAAFVVILSLISHIEKFVTETYAVVHDRSENLLQYNKILSKLVAATFQESFRQTQITSLNFPLKLSRVSQMYSRDSSGVQLADLLIGGMIEYSMTLIGKTDKTEYNQAVIGLYGDANLIHMLPNLDFEEDKKFRRGTNAGVLIDFFAKHFS